MPFLSKRLDGLPLTISVEAWMSCGVFLTLAVNFVNGLVTASGSRPWSGSLSIALLGKEYHIRIGPQHMQSPKCLEV